jgi:hypothetical protein
MAGGVAMAKLFVAEGRAIGNVAELEFYKLLDSEAQRQRQPGIFHCGFPAILH